MASAKAAIAGILRMGAEVQASIGLSERQYEDVEEFLHLFADVEASLKKRLRRRANDTTGVSTLINEYVAKNPFWNDSANRLRNLADIHNLLTHQRSTTFGYPIALAPCSLSALLEIREGVGKWCQEPFVPRLH